MYRRVCRRVYRRMCRRVYRRVYRRVCRRVCGKMCRRVWVWRRMRRQKPCGAQWLHPVSLGLPWVCRMSLVRQH